ncbi:hypothetical protein [Streptomyces sp. NPDC001450]
MTSSPAFFLFCLGLVVALLKNSELRAERAIQRKLDALAAALLEEQEGKPGKAHEDLKSVIRMEDDT